LAGYTNPDYFWTEGFGTSGAIGASGSGLFDNLLNGNWTAAGFGGGSNAIVAPLAGAGSGALSIYGTTLSKVLPGSYSTIMGTLYLNLPSGSGGLMGFLYGGDLQLYLGFSGGHFYVDNGSTVWASDDVYSFGTTNAIGYKIVFNSSTGAFSFSFNGVEDAALTQTGVNTSPQAGNLCGEFSVGQIAGSTTAPVFDHMVQACYLPSTTTTDTPLPGRVVIDQFPSGDVSKQFVPMQIAGFPAPINNSLAAQGGNILYLRQVVAPCPGTISDVYVDMTTASGADVVPCIYSDNGSNAPATLLEYGPAFSTLNPAINAVPLTSGLMVTAGTKYWIGFLASASWQPATNIDTTVGTSGEASVSYSSTPPSSAPTMTFGSPDFAFWAPIVSSGDNYQQLDSNPADGTYAFNQSATVGHADSLSFPPLPSWATEVDAVVLGCSAGIDTSGVRTFNITTTSGETTSTGSDDGFAAGGNVNTTYYSTFLVDPNTSAAWTTSGLNAADHGYDIAS